MTAHSRGVEEMFLANVGLVLLQTDEANGSNVICVVQVEERACSGSPVVLQLCV